MGMSSDISNAEGWFESFLEGLIELDEEQKKPENIDPYFRNLEGAGGIHYWQLQQCIVELAEQLIQYEGQFEILEAQWKEHETLWGRYLGTAAIEYARNWIKDPEYEDEEFSMDWFANVEHDQDGD